MTTIDVPLFWLFVLIIVVSVAAGAFGKWILDKIYWWYRDIKAVRSIRKYKQRYAQEHQGEDDY